MKKLTVNEYHIFDIIYKNGEMETVKEHEQLIARLVELAFSADSPIDSIVASQTEDATEGFDISVDELKALYTNAVSIAVEMLKIT